MYRRKFRNVCDYDWERSFVHEAFLSPKAFSSFLIRVIFNTNGRQTGEYTESLSEQSISASHFIVNGKIRILISDT